MQNEYRISVTGLGYVGLMIANAFAKKGKVIGLDKSKIRIKELKRGYDRNGEITASELKQNNIQYTTNPHELKKANFHIIAVPTPIDSNHHPDLSILLSASEILGKELKKGDIVVYESSVYPGATEEKCIPVLEKSSHLVCGKDFAVGYSPERINPADKEHILANIPKVISAINKEALDAISKVYEQIIEAGVHPVSSIPIAEAVKMVENIQRDINVSFVNEIALIMHKLGLDSKEVLTAAETKWNFLPFRPGLVGGHCVSVNSAYLTHCAEEKGYHPDVIAAGRRINEQIPKFIAESTIKELIQLDIPIKKSRIAILGLTYKENCPDVHDTRVLDIINELKTYSAEVLVHDPLASKSIAKKDLNVSLIDWKEITNADAVIVMVAHDEYRSLNSAIFKSMMKKKGVIMDIKSILDFDELSQCGFTLWRL
jgi:UDP-N-acetyl-D-galactosamine dehydrogenase